MRHLKICQLAVAVASVFAVTAASAAPISNWNYTVTSNFRTGGGAPTGGGTGTGTQGDGVSVFVPSGTTGPVAASTSSWAVSPLELNWGRNDGSVAAGTRSGLGITQAAATAGTVSATAGNTVGKVQTNGAFEAANAYTHYNNNNIGRDSWTLRSTVIDASLTLTAPGGSPVFPFVANYQINFVETPNRAAGCPTAATDGANACSDIFVLSGLLGQSFVNDGYLYTFVFGATGFGQLLDSQCALAGVAAGCVGFTTPENQDYTTQFSFALRATEIPEPASIALLGVGLLGLAGIRRRQEKNKA